VKILKVTSYQNRKLVINTLKFLFWSNYFRCWIGEHNFLPATYKQQDNCMTYLVVVPMSKWPENLLPTKLANRPSTISSPSKQKSWASKCGTNITDMRFKSHIPLNKASTTCTKNDSCWLQSVCFSAYYFSNIPFNNSCLGTDLTKSQLKVHVSIPWAKYGKEAKTGIHKCAYFTSAQF